LDRICNALPIRKPKIISGDFKAKIRKKAAYKLTIGKNSLHNNSNDNGNKLINFATKRNMRKSSTMFPHKKSKCYFGLLPFFKSNMLSLRTKLTLYKVLVRPMAQRKMKNSYL